MHPSSAAKIHLSFDTNLQRITGTASEVAMVNDGLAFMQFLSFLFQSYPDIARKYPPGKLGFLLNDQPPKDHAQLHDGDRLFFTATDEDGITRTPWGFLGRRS